MSPPNRPRSLPSISNIRLEPLGDHVVVQVLKPEEFTAGGIILPDPGQETHVHGVVLAVGPGHIRKSGVRVEPEVAVNDVVVFSRHAAHDIEIEGNELVVLRATDVLAALAGGPTTRPPKKSRPNRPRPSATSYGGLRPDDEDVDFEGSSGSPTTRPPHK